MTDVTSDEHMNIKPISDLHGEFAKNSNNTKYSNIPDLEFLALKCNTNNSDVLLPDITKCLRGIDNKLSNCWLNSIFQCLSVTYLPNLLTKWIASVAAPSFLHTCVTFFDELRARTKTNSAVKITNGSNCTICRDVSKKS